jgi:hypothetical protein
MINVNPYNSEQFKKLFTQTELYKKLHRFYTFVQNNYTQLYTTSQNYTTLLQNFTKQNF